MSDETKTVEQRLDALENPPPCKAGHTFAQGAGRAEGLIFCQRCGLTKTIAVGAAIGFEGNE